MTEPTNDQRIDYVEFAVADIGRSRDFYGKAFGWTFKDYGPQYCEFGDGRLTGGFALRTSENAASAQGGPLVIVYAIDLDAAQHRLEQAGARIVRPAYPFPGGHRFHFMDLDGYELAVWSAA